MGAISVLYKQPKRYARFLGQELTFVYRGPLLIVMPNGLAISRNGKLIPREQSIVERIAAPGTNGNTLATAATRAVVRLAAAAGVTVTSGSRTTDTDHAPLIIAAGTLALLAVGVVVRIHRRRAGRNSGERVGGERLT
jgi:hypothetical protein